MTRYEELKKIIVKLLQALPVDIMNENEIVTVGTWETFEEREFGVPEVPEDFSTRKIGAQNVLQIISTIEDFCEDVSVDVFELKEEDLPDVLTKLFEIIMDDLEEAKIIRKTPEFLRKELRLVVDNTHNDRTEEVPSIR